MVGLANALSKRGYAVDLVLARASGAFLQDVSPNVRVVNLRAGQGLGLLHLVYRRPWDFCALFPILFNRNARRTLAAIFPLARYLRDSQPVAMLSALEYGNMAAVIAGDLSRSGTRIVLSQRNHFTSDLLASRTGVSAHRRAVTRFYRRADALVAVSAGVADDLAEACALSRERIDVVYNAVADDALFEKALSPLDHPWFGTDQPPVILGVGRLEPQKDFATLLRAFATLRRRRDARLIILGEGGERGALEALALELGVSADVALPGFSDNPFAYMARADLFVLSSAFEGLPGVLIQALACGCPVVSTDCPSGPDEILEGGRHGPLVPVGDAAAMTNAMKTILDAPPDRDALKRRGAFFSPEKAADLYLDVLLDRQPADASRT